MLDMQPGPQKSTMSAHKIPHFVKFISSYIALVIVLINKKTPFLLHMQKLIENQFLLLGGKQDME